MLIKNSISSGSAINSVIKAEGLFLPIWYGTQSERIVPLLTKRPTYVENADVVADWQSGAEALLNTDHYQHSTVSGGGSIEGAKAFESGNLDLTISADGIGGNWHGQNINQFYVRVRFWLEENMLATEPLTDNAALSIQFQIGKDLSNIYKYTLSESDIYRQGWNERWFYIHPTTPPAETGTWDSTTEVVGFMKFNANGEPTAAGFWVLDSIEFYATPFLSKPIVCVTLDDGQSIQKEMIAYASAKGIPVTMFVHGAAAEGDLGGGFLTTAELQELQKNSMVLICNHTWDNDVPTSLVSADSTITDAEARSNLHRNIEWMQANNFLRGAGFMSWPQGRQRWSAPSFQAIDEFDSLMMSFRDIGGNDINDGIPNAVHNVFNRREIKTSVSPSYLSGLGGSFSAAEIYTTFKTAKGILVSYGHDLTEISRTQWVDFIDTIATDVAAGNVRAVLYDELLIVR